MRGSADAFPVLSFISCTRSKSGSRAIFCPFCPRACRPSFVLTRPCIFCFVACSTYELFSHHKYGLFVCFGWFSRLIVRWKTFRQDGYPQEAYWFCSI